MKSYTVESVNPPRLIEWGGQKYIAAGTIFSIAGKTISELRRWRGGPNGEWVKVKPFVTQAMLRWHNVPLHGVRVTSGSSRAKQLPEKVVQVAGRNGNVYNVTWRGSKPVACSCPGFTYHGHCKHT